MSPRHTRSALPAAVMLVGAVVIGLFVQQSLTTSSSSAAAPVEVPDAAPAPTVSGLRPDPPPPEEHHPLDEDPPTVANLDPALHDALRRATAAAAGDGVGIVVNSGWRSREAQERLLQQAISKYGSRAEAARWVATPDTSEHVSGDAIDVGPSKAAKWLSKHGDAYGLCRIYRNEPWHFELRPEAIGRGCPPMYADPTQDPRMQR